MNVSSVTNTFDAAKVAVVNLFNPTAPVLDVLAMTKAAKLGNSFLRNALNTNAVTNLEEAFPTHAMIDGVMTDISDLPRHQVLQGDDLAKAVEAIVTKVKNA